MTTTIITKNSSTASAVPSTSDLVQGELAVNVTDKRLFTENASSTIVELGTNPSSITTGTITATGTVTANSNLSSSNAVLTGGTVNGIVIGGTTPSAITGTNITANTGFSGPLTGNVTGNLTGNVTGNITGDLTGNVTASSGTTTLNNLVINGTVDFNTAVLTDLGSPVSSTDAATKGYVDTEISNLIGGAPAALDTLNELAAALNDDAAFNTTITNSIATKLPLAGGTMSGAIAMGSNKITGLGTPTAGTDAATKAYADTMLPLAGGTMTGNIVLGSNKATSTATPSTDDDLTRKGYVDSILGSATSAATSAANAATSESNAATSASNASTSASNAATSETNAAASYDAFDDRYLGDKASDPTVDNDGNALLTGALYFNTTTDDMKVYNGSAWQATAITTSNPTFTGTVTADGLTVDGDSEISATRPILDLMCSGATDENTRIDVNLGNLRVRTLNDAKTTAKERVSIDNGTGDISFYEDTGTTAKFFWDASAESLGIGTSSPTGKVGVEIGASSNNGFVVSSANDALVTGNHFYAVALRGDTSAYNLLKLENSLGTKMIVQGNGNVGIGTSSPASDLDIRTGTATAAKITLNNNAGTPCSITAGSNAMTFNANVPLWKNGAATTEYMRIDSSGNLLVGTTSTSISSSTGTVLDNRGIIFTSANDVYSIYANRTGSDGDIVTFRRDGTTVGSIGANGNDLTIGTGDVGLKFNDAAGLISPWDMTANAPEDAAIDLGYSTGRFKDLYLSGGVYLGGTTSANKLDDYETGTWTPTFTNLTLGNGVAEGRYTKIGRTVTLEVNVTWGSTTSASGAWYVNNIPFVSAATHRAYGSGNILDSGTANHTTHSEITESQSNLYFSATYITGTYTRYSSITDTIPMTWTTGDFVKTSIVYTAA